MTSSKERVKKMIYDNEKIIKNALVNSFVDYCLYYYLGQISYHVVANREDIRKVNTYFKLSGKNFLDELYLFAQNIDVYDRDFDFGLDHYDLNYVSGKELYKFHKGF